MPGLKGVGRPTARSVWWELLTNSNRALHSPWKPIAPCFSRYFFPQVLNSGILFSSCSTTCIVNEEHCLIPTYCVLEWAPPILRIQEECTCFFCASRLGRDNHWENRQMQCPAHLYSSTDNGGGYFLRLSRMTFIFCGLFSSNHRDSLASWKEPFFLRKGCCNIHYSEPDLRCGCSDLAIIMDTHHSQSLWPLFFLFGPLPSFPRQKKEAAQYNAVLCQQICFKRNSCILHLEDALLMPGQITSGGTQQVPGTEKRNKDWFYKRVKDETNYNSWVFLVTKMARKQESSNCLHIL